MKKLSLCLCALPIAAAASALPVVPVIQWQVSADGASWSNEVIFFQGVQTVKVRAQLSWSDSGSGAIGLGAALCSFDATIYNMSAGDSITNIQKTLVPAGGSQDLAFTRLGINGKIDVNTDTLAPGLGPGWCNMGQASPNVLGSSFDYHNPITLMTYDYVMDDELHIVSFGSIGNSAAFQAVQIYMAADGTTTGGGRFSRAGVIVVGATIANFTPSPGPLTLIVPSCLFLTRRRR